MHSLKQTFFGLIIVVVIFLAWAAMLPKKLELAKSRTYNTTADSLYTHISAFAGWEHWFPWQDQNLETHIKGKPGSGQRLEWKHPEAGRGYMEILSLREDSLICLEIVFDENAEPVLSDLHIIQKATGETELIWHLYDSIQYDWPMGRIRAFAIKKMAGRNIESALEDLQSNMKN
ncbi:MAG: hypothetical protein PF590_00920 [Candidatus Delongbacteria bacterium]|jgi:hypothetical protein|nr:hypothetical protein [Candidatus Delongbacteria bacterium]